MLYKLCLNDRSLSGRVCREHGTQIVFKWSQPLQKGMPWTCCKNCLWWIVFKCLAAIWTCLKHKFNTMFKAYHSREVATSWKQFVYHFPGGSNHSNTICIAYLIGLPQTIFRPNTILRIRFVCLASAIVSWISYFFMFVCLVWWIEIFVIVVDEFY